MPKFDYKKYLIQIKGNDYLPVAARTVWFRNEHPNGTIRTELVSTEPLIMRAEVYTAEGVLLGTGHGSANSQGKSVVWLGRDVEKAETAAKGRALATAGYGTEYTDELDLDLENLADSPVKRSGPAGKASRRDLAYEQASIAFDSRDEFDTWVAQAIEHGLITPKNTVEDIVLTIANARWYRMPNMTSSIYQEYRLTKSQLVAALNASLDTERLPQPGASLQDFSGFYYNEIIAALEAK